MCSFTVVDRAYLTSSHKQKAANTKYWQPFGLPRWFHLKKGPDPSQKHAKLFTVRVFFCCSLDELVSHKPSEAGEATALCLFPFACAQVAKITLPPRAFFIVIDQTNAKANIRNSNAKRSLFAAFGCGLGRGCHRPRFLFAFTAGFDLQTGRR